ncbi:unnamed protein product [Symbiodinium sp. CCMP2456]|nr:unnamed protein product [Symbiodinium sp. CCMP2456]
MTTKAGEQNQSEKSEAKALAKQWMEQEGMKERGAAGRIILAGNHLTRADLSVNWEIVAKAIKVYGSRPSVFVLEDAVAEFFAGTRPLGKPVPSNFAKNQGWRIRNLITMFVRIAKLPHRPTEEGIRRIYEAVDIPIPEGRSSSSLPDVSDVEDGAECEAGCKVFAGILIEMILGLMPSYDQGLEEGEEEQATEDACEEATMLN